MLARQYPSPRDLTARLLVITQTHACEHTDWLWEFSEELALGRVPLGGISLSSFGFTSRPSLRVKASGESGLKSQALNIKQNQNQTQAIGLAERSLSLQTNIYHLFKFYVFMKNICRNDRVAFKMSLCNSERQRNALFVCLPSRASGGHPAEGAPGH